MLLGRLLSEMSDEAGAAAGLAAIGDVGLMVRLSAAAAAHGETPAEYLQAACRLFANTADNNAWAGLVNAIERQPEPGPAALRHMLEWALARDEAGTSTAGGPA